MICRPNFPSLHVGKTTKMGVSRRARRLCYTGLKFCSKWHPALRSLMSWISDIVLVIGWGKERVEGIVEVVNGSPR